MKVKSYESKYELPKQQQDMLKKMVHDKTGLDEGKVIISTTGKVQAVVSDSELWLMMEATLSEEEQYGNVEGNYGEAYISNPKNENSWIAKAFIFIKIKGPDSVLDSTQLSQKDLEKPFGDNKELENSLQEIIYKTQKMFDNNNDIEVDFQGSVLPNSDVILFLLLWKKSMINNNQHKTKNKKED
jgi:hypothetical protein